MSGIRLAMVVVGLAAVGAAAYPALSEEETATPASADAPAPTAVQTSMVAADRQTAQAVVDGGDAPDEAEPADPERVAEPDEPRDDADPTEDDETEDDEPEDDDSQWVGPPELIPECEAKLDAAGVKWQASRIPLHKTKGGYYCGAEQIVRYQSGPGKIQWGGKPKVTCGVALGLSKLEAIVQEEAQRHFERRVKRIGHMGTYNCREMANY
ncbi:MAG: extensin family protein, partial [Deltaproteobacteria bacterium]|nr:extensin family protein [Deltaproteobacteria bacterium]